MVGIASYGAYIPIYRLSRETISKEWGTSAGHGEKSVRNYDEDSITMAVEAAIDCLNGVDRSSVDGLYFASTTPPYREKQSASIVAAALDLRRDELFTADFANSLRAGTIAMKAATDAVNGGSAKNVLVVASDCRLPAPNSELEPLFADGAAAVLVSNSKVAASIEQSHAIYSELMDQWRTDEDKYPQVWEDRFIHQQGYVNHVRDAVSALLNKSSLKPQDFEKAVLYAPDARRHQEIARLLGFDTKSQLQDGMFDSLGNTGAAFALMVLVSALEQSKAGDKLLFASYGDGCDAHIMVIKEPIDKIKNRRGIKHHLASKMMLPSYGTYLRFRNLLEWEAERRPPDRSAPTLLNRERKQVFSLIGQKCKSCGGIQYPAGRICTWCQTKDNFEDFGLSDKKGTVFTFSMDERAMEADLPNVLCIVDFEGGGRFYSQMTDRDPEKIEVGMAVEPTFRRIHSGSGLHNYFWKVRPLRY